MQSLKEKAYQQLKSYLLDGQLPEGSLLSERKLGDQLGMSKTPIRAALERLEAEGFITTAPQQGILVRELSVWEIRDHYEMRAVLESYIVSQLAGNLTGDQERMLADNLTLQESTMQDGDTSAHVAADAAFHMLMAQFLGNQEILRVMEHQREKLSRVALRLSRQFPDRMAKSLAEHRALYTAICNGDSDLAAILLKEHLAMGKHALLGN